MLDILKAPTINKWGKLKELIVSTFKAMTGPILEYANTIGALSYLTPTSKTANHSEHSYANCFWLHKRYKHSTLT